MNNQVRLEIKKLLSLVSGKNEHAQMLQIMGPLAGLPVRAGHLISQGLGNFCQAAHADSTDADEIDSRTHGEIRNIHSFT